MPPLPIGFDAYRQWERWPQQRIGARTYMRSTYDRSGGNEGADAGHFLYQSAENRNVTLDVVGPGILYFARYNHWHGSPWHDEVDGVDHAVWETSTLDPLHPKANSIFEPARAFPAPLAVTWGITRGADLSWVPIGFENSFRMAYERTCYGTGYYIYQQWAPGARLSQPLRAWDGTGQPDPDVLELIGRSGADIAPAGQGVSVRLQNLSLQARSGGEPILLAGPGVIRAILISAPRENSLALDAARLRVRWDDRDAPSVDAPAPLFFGTGTLFNRDDKEYLVKSFPMTVRFDAQRVHLACYFPMPFFKSARLELINEGQVPLPDIHVTVRSISLADAPDRLGYFHATYRDFPTPAPGKDLIFLNTAGEEGSDVWSGSFVGTSFIFTHDSVLTTLEGDPRFFFDDSQTPQGQGTGTEEWGGGGDYWGGATMTLPFAGHPVGAKPKQARSQVDKIHSAYRFLLADLFPFGRNARIQFEHGGTDESKEHYEAVTYWYGLPAASLVASDELRAGDQASERLHDYRSPEAGLPYEITSRYEWGVDHLGKTEVFPATTDRARATSGTSEFTLKLDPSNVGVMLRRKLDYLYPNQRAEVWIADASKQGEEASDRSFKLAGIWYLAGSNTCVFSKPSKELDLAQHILRVSNRRFRDDEFLVPAALTAGRSAVRVRVRFTPVRRPLFPGQPIPDLKWSEIRYTAYCFVMPHLKTFRDDLSNRERR